MGKPETEKSIREKLLYLYGKRKGEVAFRRLLEVFSRYKRSIQRKNFELSEKDAVLITYGDSFRVEKEKPLETLRKFLTTYLNDNITIVHLLPFFPYSSDGGFSVIDYYAVNPELGSWDEIEALGKDFVLMFDAVINHISAQSSQFLAFLKGDKGYRDFFITLDPMCDTSKVFRPRALPLLTPFETARGKLNLWTTFSADQVDLNYRNPDVLLFIVDVLLFYVAHGASLIRFDAIAFLWKEVGTRCLHLPQTHVVIKLFRNILDLIAPHVKIITETNVPHDENISYFGNGRDEAHIVYNFALPPLTAHAIITGTSRYLSEWASTLRTRGDDTFFYNFTASHDGVGLLPARGILPHEEIERLVHNAKSHGGKLGLKDNPDGTKSVYELNITYFDLLSNPFAGEPQEKQVSRFIASQGIALTLAGLPALYYHSLLGSRNFYEGVERTRVNRAINREKLDLKSVEEDLNKKDTVRSVVFHALKRLLGVRRAHPAFHPGGSQRVLDLHPCLFAVERAHPEGKEVVLCVINVSDGTITIPHRHPCRKDLLSGRTFKDELTVRPYDVLWLGMGENL